MSKNEMRYAVKFHDITKTHATLWRLQASLTRRGVPKKDLITLEARLFSGTSVQLTDKWMETLSVTWNHILFIPDTQFAALVPLWETIRGTGKTTWFANITPMLPLTRGGLAIPITAGYIGQHLPYALTPKGQALLSAWDKAKSPSQNTHIPNF